MAPSVSIVTHTTASSPRPHILYTIKANVDGKQEYTSKRRYSEFVVLHSELNDPYNLPPKRILVTTFIPSAWVDDTLIEERKNGLADYLLALLSNPKYSSQRAVLNFLSAEKHDNSFSLEDAVPSTLSRKKALSLATALDGDVGTEATPISAAYYPNWSSGSNPPENLDYSKFDIIFFAFATPNSGSGIDVGSESVLQRLADSARNSGRGTKVVLSIGGWGGCQWYSQSVSNAGNRTTFANACANIVNRYGLDGIDLDWEYPNSPGAGQPYSSSDAANYLSFLQVLRSTLGQSKIISAAVAHMPWLGSNGQPLNNVSAYAAQMTYVNIMNYDVWGASSTPGPNAPMANLCNTSWQPQASAQAALNQWTAAGFPASKILLGLPLYGYVSQSSKTTLTGSSVPSSKMVLIPPLPEIKEDSENAEGEVTFFLNGAHPNPPVQGEMKAQATLTQYWGQQIAFKDIVGSGALARTSDGNYGQAGGFTMAWDDCSNTPYLYNTSQSTVVTYDDTWSLADKANFAKNNGMAGCFTWSLDQDDGYTLQNAIRKALGK